MDSAEEFVGSLLVLGLGLLLVPLLVALIMALPFGVLAAVHIVFDVPVAFDLVHYGAALLLLMLFGASVDLSSG